MIGMLGVVPPKCKNTQLDLEPLVKMFATLKPGTSGMRIRSPLSAEDEIWWAMIVCTINDMRGISKGNCQKQAPSKLMACNDCAIRGMNPKCYGTTLYPGTFNHMLTTC